MSESKLKRLDCEALHQIYELVDQVRGDELAAAHKGTKAAFTRMRVQLSEVSKLCKQVRKHLLKMRNGGANGKSEE